MRLRLVLVSGVLVFTAKATPVTGLETDYA